MKYALSSRQTPDYLKLADEIRVEYRDREIIYDFIEKYPDKTYILEIPYYIAEETIDFQEIITLNKLTQNLICRLSRVEDIQWCRENEIRWFYGMVVDKWEDLISLAYTDAEYVLIGGDLFFDLPRVKGFGIPIRVVPNVASVPQLSTFAALEFDISIVGDWFPPEARYIYEDYVEAIEFENCNLQQERAMYRIWSHDGWPGDERRIITNLNTEAEGRMLNPEWFSRNRLDCGRTCLKKDNVGCQLCYRQFTLANYERMKGYVEQAQANEESE